MLDDNDFESDFWCYKAGCMCDTFTQTEEQCKRCLYEYHEELMMDH